MTLLVISMPAMVVGLITFLAIYLYVYVKFWSRLWGDVTTYATENRSK